jgi:FG-GAP-like repeat
LQRFHSPGECDLGGHPPPTQSSELFDHSGFGAAFVQIADVNGDGKPDLIVANANNSTVGVLLGNGDGTFQAALSSDVVQGAVSLAVADINGDGKLDLLVSNGCDNSCSQGISNSTVAVLLGNGDGTFQPAVTYASDGRGTDSIGVADVNADGKADVVVTNFASNTLAVLLGNGDGTLRPALTFDSGGDSPLSVALADLNGDGSPDLAVANDTGPPGSTRAVAVLLNNTPFCTTPPVITLSATPTSLWPPSGKMEPVTVFGTITDPGCTITSAAYAVADEYGEIQPSGVVTLRAGGVYSFTVLLQASRLGTDLDGRLYTITVSASNNAGKTGSQAGPVIVPHDRGH